MGRTATRTTARRVFAVAAAAAIGLGCGSNASKGRDANGQTDLAPTTRVNAYVKGVLIYGTEP
jgi:hypothetical protein